MSCVDTCTCGHTKSNHYRDISETPPECWHNCFGPHCNCKAYRWVFEKKPTSTLSRFALGSIVAIATCSTWAQTGRVVDTPCTHVGVRPSADAVDEWAVTVQVSTDWPAACTVRSTLRDAS